jgi:hypothetical protein
MGNKQKTEDKDVMSPYVQTKVVICMPAQNTVTTRCAASLVQMVNGSDIDTDFILRSGCDIVGSRTWLVKEAIRVGGTHMLFIDDDMCSLFNEENVIKTLLSHDKDIVGVNYNMRKFPLQNTAIPLTEITDTTRLYKAKALGTGFLLIKLSVFDKIPEPWFQFGRKADGELAFGEDTYFCQEAIKAGFDVWVDPDVKVQHVGEYLF